MRTSILSKIGWLKRRGMSDEKAAELEAEVKAGLYFFNLMKSEHWVAQESLEIQTKNRAIKGLGQEELSERDRICFNTVIKVMDDLILDREAIIQKGTFAQDALNRYTKEKEDD